MRRRELDQTRCTLSQGSSIRLGVVVIAILLVGFAPGCSPTEPTGAAEGVTIYERAGYQGQARRLGADERDLDDVSGPCGGDWDDCISSIRVPEGWQVVIYEDPDFQGPSNSVTSDIRDLADYRVSGWNTCGGVWDNCISSIRVSQQ